MASLSTLLNALTDCAAILDSQGVVICANESWRRRVEAHCEWGKKQCEGCNFWEQCKLSTLPANHAALQAIEAVLTKNENRFEIEYEDRREGASSWFRLIASPLELEDGGAGALLLMQDITETVTARRALNESEARLRVALDSAECGIWDYDPATGKNSWDEKSYKLLGYEPYSFEPAFEHIMQRIHPEDASRFLEELGSTYHNGKMFSIEFRIILPDDSIRWIRSTGKSHFDIHGQCVRRTGIFEDASLQHATEEQIYLQSAALEVAADAIFIVNVNGIIEWVNEAFCEMYGYTRAEALGKNPRMLKSGLHDHAFYVKLWGTISSGQVWRGKITNRHKDGSLRLTRQTVTPVCGANGRPHHYISINQNIDMQSLQEQQIQAFFGHAPSLNFIKDRDLKFISVNQNFAARLGCASQDLIGRRLTGVFPEKELERLEQEERRVLETGELFQYEFKMRHGGQETVYQITLYPVRRADVGIESLCGVMQDISRQKKLEEELRFSQKLEGVGRLASGVAHDFNNLLSVILGFSELILQEQGNLPEKQKDRLKEIRHAADRAAALTRQLLAFARRQALFPRTFDVPEMIGNLLKMLRRLLGEDILIETDFAVDAWPVHADQAQLEQVLVNLAVNARDAMAGGGVLRLEASNLSVTDALRQLRPELKENEYAMIRVMDTGSGMEAQTLEKIFEPFFTTKEAGKGTGLGLSLCYSVVTQAGGAIWAESAPGNGSCFTICLPRSRQAVASSDAESGIPDETGHETILLVEDEPAVSNVMRKMLCNRGYEVYPASHALEALQFAGSISGPIDLLITDIVMPGMNGKDLAETLRHGRPDLKVLFVSGYTDEIIGPMDLGEKNTRFLPKPFSNSKLLSAVRDFLDVDKQVVNVQKTA